MFKIIKEVFVLIILSVFVLNFFALPVLAKACEKTEECPIGEMCDLSDPSSATYKTCVPKSGSTGGDSVRFDNPISSPTIQALIADITNWLINIGLAIAVLMLIYGALVFITAGGVENRVTKGRQILLWSVIGLATLLLAKGAEFVIRSFLV